MKINEDLTLAEIAAIVSDALTKANIIAVLTGGGAVTIYSENEYQSDDLDFISPADSQKLAEIMDRLAGFYHWSDRQNLDQAVMVAKRHQIDFKKVQSWSHKEGHLQKYQEFLDSLK